MTRNRYGRDTREYHREQAALRMQRRTRCQITGIRCQHPGQPIRYDGDPRHPLAFSAHHVQAASHGGPHAGNLVSAHYGCNAAAGNGQPRGFMRNPALYGARAARGARGRFTRRTMPALGTSREW